MNRRTGLHRQFYRVAALVAILFLFGPVPNASAQMVFDSADSAVQFALQNSKSQTLQQISILENMKMAKYSFRDFLPSIGVSWSEADSVSVQSADSRSKSLQLTMTQLLFDGGVKKLAYDMNNINAYYAYQEYEQSVRQFSSDIIAVYYQYLMQREMLTVQNDLLDAANRQLAVIEKETSLGLTLETDYLEYLISCLQVENERDQAVRDLEVCERKLKQALGLERHTAIRIDDTLADMSDFSILEEYIEDLWPLVRKNSLDLKKQNTALAFSEKQAQIKKRWFLPEVSLQAGVSFSGNSYPLTEPKYSVKLMFSFSNNPAFPLSFSSGYGFERNRLYNVNNSADVSLLQSITFMTESRLSDISLTQSRLQLDNLETALYESLYDAIINHDGGVRSLIIGEKTAMLQERRLAVRKLEVEKGELKPIDFLKELIELSKQKLTNLRTRNSIIAAERSLEILMRIPFGELLNVCEQL